MDKYTLKHTNVRIPLKYIRKVEEMNINLSTFLRDLLENYFQDKNLKLEKIKEYEKKIKELKEEVEYIEKPLNIMELPDRERIFLEKAQKIIGENPEFFNAQYNLWIENFGKGILQTREKFDETLSKINEVKNGKKGN